MRDSLRVALQLTDFTGVVTGVPGILFGVTSAVGGAAVSKVKAKTHEKRVSKKPGQITVAPVRAEALANPRAEHTGAGSMVMKKTKLSPYIKATLLMPGVDPSKDAFHGKTKPHLSGGTDFTFASSNHVTLGFEDVDLLDQAGLLLEVKDKPDFALAKTLTHRDTHIGRAVVHLAQLQTAVAATPEGESAVVSAFINVPFYRDAEWADSAATPSGGMVRFKITLEA